MTATARLFFHDGLETADVVAGNVLRLDSVMMLRQPYLASEQLSATTGTQDDSSAAPARTRLAYIQVQEGKKVAFERTTSSADLRTVSATTSPVISGSQTIVCGPGDRISILEVSS